MRVFLTAVAAVGLMSSAALANPWFEQGDAGDFPAGTYQVTQGFGPLTTIHGATNSATQDWVDSYCIKITDVQAFYATTNSAYDSNAMADWDTRLFLWDLQGNLIMANDDTPSPWSSLQSLLTDPSTYPHVLYNDPQYIIPDECYILSITGYSNDAMDATNTAMVAFGSDFDALHGQAPGTGPFSHWENLGATGEYTIALNGCTFCVPAPGTLALLGFAGLVMRRRR